MTKRKKLAVIIALSLCISLCACSAETPSYETDDQSVFKTFTVVAEGNVGSYAAQTIMYDPDTQVMYSYFDGSYAGCVTKLYNADGTYKLYSPGKEYTTFIVVAEENVGSYAAQTIMYDPDTQVMYSFFDGSYAGDVTELYNADTTLKLYPY